MKQLFRALVVAVLLAAVGPVGALGLGELEKNSALNERFNGRIPLVSVSADEISTLQVGLADESAFERADVVYSPVLRDLKFELVEPKSGPDYIQITSNDPIREPFLNFLVELNWASGRIFREYTVLLDPPLYDPQQRAASTSTASTPAQESPAASVSQEGHQVNYPEDTAPRQRPVSPASAYSGGDYGPTRSGDTLWSIANEMKPASVTTHQMMLALLRANPDAFIGNNINGLKRGAILEMPDRQQMNAVNQSEALAQVKNQHGLWDGARQAMAAEPGQRADTTTAAPTTEPSAGMSETGGESGSRLELVGTEEGATGQTGDTEGSGQTAEKLAVANENLESLRQENAELKDRLAQNEALIEDLKRLIALKNDELASLQGRTAEEAAGTESAPAGMVDMVEGVNYPNGDPSQFMNETTGDDELLPGPVPPDEPLSHTVNRPADAGTPATTTDATGDETAGQAAGEGEKADTEPAQTAPSEPAQPAQQPAADSGGIVAMLMGYAATARTFLLNNLMIVGAVLLAIIVLLAGSTYMRRRQTQLEEEADAAIASGTFPDFNAGDAADQTSFDNDAESATELNAAAATAADDATEISTGSGAETSDEGDEDLFVVPQGEQEPQYSADEDDEDPLAEVNVLMAYEHFDQAESFVRNALKSDPNNVEYQAKLLEVFYAAGNKKKYEEAASDLRDMTGGQGEHWDMAVAMWQEMSPNRALFEGGGDEEDEQAADSTGGGGIVDITGDTAGGSSAQETSDTGGGLDFDLGDSTGGGSGDTSDASSEMLDITASEEASGNDDMLDLTAAESSSGDDDMLDVTSAASQVDDDDTMLDMTAAGSTEAESEEQSGSRDSEDDSFEFSLGDDDQNDSDLLDVTQSGSVDSNEDLLDVTSGGQASQSSADEDDNSLDFSLDMDSGSNNELDSEAMTAPDTATEDDASTMAAPETEFDLDSGESGSTGDEVAESSDDSDNGFDFDLDIGDSGNAADEQAASGSDDSKSDTDDSFEMDLEIQDDSDSNDLDEIGDELDRLEQTLGTLSHKENQDTTKGFGSNTSDALDGIDSALEDMETELGGDSDTDTAKTSGDTGDADDAGIEMSLDDGTSSDDKAGSADDLDLSLDGVQSDDSDNFSDFNLDTDSTAESDKNNDDTSSVSLESGDDDDFSDFDFDIGTDDDSGNEGATGKDESASISLDSGDDDLTSDLSGFDFDLDSGNESGDPAGGSETADNDLSAELSEISQELGQELDSGDQGSSTADASDAGEQSMNFELDTSEASGSGSDLEFELDDNAAADGSSNDDTQTMQMNVSGDSSDETDFSSELDLDLSADNMSASEGTNGSIDMDSTVELPKDKLSGSLSLNDDEGESDGNDDEDSTLFVGRSSDTEEQSLEDELTTKLDLAKAYVELGDADSARGILEEVKKDGNDDQKRQAGELLEQL